MRDSEATVPPGDGPDGDPTGGRGPGPSAPRPLRARLLAPIVAQLTQGTSPERVAATLAVGTACSLLPFLGLTSLLNLAVGVALRMNQAILQVLNQLLGPVQLLLILGYVRLGELLVGADPSERFAIGELVSAFRDLPLGDFLARFGRAGAQALLAWTVTAPLLAVAVLVLVRPFVRRFARGLVDRPRDPRTA